MHLYSGLQSLLEVYVTSTCCYSECLHLDESSSKFPLLAASQRSLCSHSQHLQHTYFGHSVATFGREFLRSVRGTFLSLSLALIGTLLLLSLGGLANFFQLHLFFCPPTVVYKINQRQNHHKKNNLCQVLHKSVECLRGENIGDGCDQVQMEYR